MAAFVSIGDVLFFVGGLAAYHFGKPFILATWDKIKALWAKIV